MTAFIRKNRWKMCGAGACLLVVVALLLTVWNVRSSSASVESAPHGPALELLDRAAQARAQGDFVTSALLYIELLDRYPDTLEKLEATAALTELRYEAQGGGLSPEVLMDFESRLPRMEEFNSIEAKNVLVFFNVAKASVLTKFGLQEMATQVLKDSCEAALGLLRDYPESPVLIEGLFNAVEYAPRVGPEYLEAVVLELESFIDETEPCMGVWASRYALMHHYLHAGRNRPAAERHIAALLDAAEADYVQGALQDPYTRLEVKGAIHWALGYARYEAGEQEEALLDFDTVLSLCDGDNRLAEWAAITAPSALGKLYPETPSVAVAAYEDYLTVRGDKEYAEWALLELGNLHRDMGDLVKAEQYYERVLDEHPGGHAVETARFEVAEVSRERVSRAVE